MTDCELAMELYRDGMARAKIRQKLGIDTATLSEYLADEPPRSRKPGGPFRYTPHKPTEANVRGSAMIERGIPAKAVHAELMAQGLKVSLSTIMRWQTQIKGKQNNRVPKGDYPVIHELFTAQPNVRGMELSKLYYDRTGRRLDRRAAHHWCQKLRAAA